MRSLKFNYTSDGVSHFELVLYADGDHLERHDLSLMGDYIHLVFLTMKRIGSMDGGLDIDAMIRDLLRGEGT